VNTSILHYVIVALDAAVAALAYLPYGWAHIAAGAIAAGLAVVVGSATATVQIQARAASKPTLK
jgi:hypothetical protein